MPVRNQVPWRSVAPAVPLARVQGCRVIACAEPEVGDVVVAAALARGTAPPASAVARPSVTFIIYR